MKLFNLPYDVQYLVLCYLLPEEVAELKEPIRLTEFNRNFDQDLEHVNIYNCIRRIKEELFVARNIKFLEIYLDHLIRNGLRSTSGKYNYKREQLVNLTQVVYPGGKFYYDDYDAREFSVLFVTPKITLEIF